VTDTSFNYRTYFHINFWDKSRLSGWGYRQPRAKSTGLLIFFSPITNHQSRITHHALRITHYASRITHYPSPITHHQSPITNHQSPITNHVLLLRSSPIQHSKFNIQNYPPLPGIKEGGMINLDIRDVKK
jgi:hypothetical protein